MAREITEDEIRKKIDAKRKALGIVVTWDNCNKPWVKKSSLGNRDLDIFFKKPNA